MRSLTSLSLLPELAAVEVEADVTREEEAMVVPVRVESRVWTEDRALVTELMADSMEVTWVFMEVFSASVQVTVEGTSEISLASAEMSAVGFCETLVDKAAALVRISAQLVAVARTLLPEVLLELDKLLIFSLAADRLALLAARVVALAVSLVESWAHAMMAGIASSSYFLHTLKAF